MAETKTVPEWYDRGGPVPPGRHEIVNGTGRSEEILTPDERDAFVRLGRQG